MAHIIIPAHDEKELQRVIDKMTNAAGTQPSVFAIADNTSEHRIVSYRVQHNDLGWAWFERELPEYTE